MQKHIQLQQELIKGKKVKLKWRENQPTFVSGPVILEGCLPRRRYFTPEGLGCGNSGGDPGDSLSPALARSTSSNKVEGLGAERGSGLDVWGPPPRTMGGEEVVSDVLSDLSLYVSGDGTTTAISDRTSAQYNTWDLPSYRLPPVLLGYS